MDVILHVGKVSAVTLLLDVHNYTSVQTCLEIVDSKGGGSVTVHLSWPEFSPGLHKLPQLCIPKLSKCA